MKKRLPALALAFLLAACFLPINTAAAGRDVTIVDNPYRNVDWETWGAYRAALHTHSTLSDGYASLPEMVEAHYARGYDILAMTDHGVTDRSWTKPNYTPLLQWVQQVDKDTPFFPDQEGLTEERFREITDGVGEHREGRGMLRVPYGIELNATAIDKSHVNSFFSDWGTALVGGTFDLETPIRAVNRRGGLCFLNHVSDVTFNKGLPYEESYEGWRYNRVYLIQRLLEKYPALLGIEIPDGEDHKLWDLLLINVAAKGRNVFGFNTTDAHRVDDKLDRGWVLALMPENTVENLRTCMETGAMLSFAHYINSYWQLDRWKETTGKDWGERHWNADKTQPDPEITNITAAEGRITIEHKHVTGVHWISNGQVISTESSIDLNTVGGLGAYVRAELIGPGGVLYTQPFLLEYEGSPKGRDLPATHFEHGWIFAFFRNLLFYPIAFVADQISLLRYR